MSPALHSTAYLLEEKRLQEQREKLAQQRADREAAEARNPKKRRKPTPWVDDVRAMIVKNGERLFKLEDLDYAELQRRHPKSATIEASTRWALQQLRDLGEVFFVDYQGSYIYLPFEKGGAAS